MMPEMSGLIWTSLRGTTAPVATVFRTRSVVTGEAVW